MYDDVKIEFYHGRNADKRLFHFWFHTSFIDSDGILVINKDMTESAFKDKQCLRFDRNFQVKVQFTKIDNYEMKTLELPKMPRKVKKSKNKSKS